MATVFVRWRRVDPDAGWPPRRTTMAAVSVALSLAVMAGSGCGYSLAGRGSFLPAHIRTIGVPLFANHTQVFEIERRVTDRVRSELIGRGRYKVQPERTGVDAVLSGEIVSLSLVPAAFTPEQQASRYTLTLVATIEFRDQTSDKVLWSNPAMQFSEQFDVSTATTGGVDAHTFLGQDINAQERVATEFARALVSAILEAF